ncbi:hypothetical protein [Clostridium formicaceticum]|uniref:Rubrerythrin diiron-binding domain-containing protein n=1 Tax=Clostridium formicaceticum TaxID=1497 RepID=A0AAC9RPK5_9CLOT|nr:hypothetical protein [Clostridium formicaceticum]AOY78037.1 hypothetical protein BJL90_20520 [Clostridium formicaceticum]ARE88673.1 hypothetical protein CLFO_30790 [Clostridium formicaceticum]
MGYTIIDVLDKLIKVKEIGHNMYAAIVAGEETNARIKTVAKVFAIEKNKHIMTYKSLRNQMITENFEEIDFDIYDKVSKLISRFNYAYPENIMDIKEFLRFSLKFEKENLALVINIQGLFVRTLKDIDSSAYNVLAEIIKEEEKHIRSIEIFVK